VIRVCQHDGIASNQFQRETLEALQKERYMLIVATPMNMLVKVNEAPDQTSTFRRCGQQWIDHISQRAADLFWLERAIDGVDPSPGERLGMLEKGITPAAVVALEIAK